MIYCVREQRKDCLYHPGGLKLFSKSFPNTLLMQTKRSTIWIILTLFFVSPLFGQDWSDYRHLFGLLKKQEQDLFRQHLQDLMGNLQRGSNDQIAIFGTLREQLPGATNPTAGVSAMLTELAVGRDNLAAILEASGALSGEAGVIMGIFDAGNAAWISQLETIRIDFQLAQNTYNGVDQQALYRAKRAFQAADWERRNAMAISFRQFNEAVAVGSDGAGQPDLGALLQAGPLEAGAGVQSGKVTYYSFAPDAGQFALIRFGSAPRYDQLWGMEWDSWISVAPQAPKQSLVGGENVVQTTEPSSYPVMAGGSLSFQYRPILGFLGSRVRLIAGMGAKADTYVPKRIIPGIPETFDNQGKTTGIGPSARLGFSVITGGVMFYAVSNTTRGFVIRCPDYPYISNQLTSGVSWGKYHFRISTGDTRWAINKRRMATYTEASFNIALTGN